MRSPDEGDALITRNEVGLLSQRRRLMCHMSIVRQRMLSKSLFRNGIPALFDCQRRVVAGHARDAVWSLRPWRTALIRLRPSKTNGRRQEHKCHLARVFRLSRTHQPTQHPKRVKKLAIIFRIGILAGVFCKPIIGNSSMRLCLLDTLERSRLLPQAIKSDFIFLTKKLRGQ